MIILYLACHWLAGNSMVSISMPIRLQFATDDDAPGLVRLREAVNLRLAREYGYGYWCAELTERAALSSVRHSPVYVIRQSGEILATLALSARKPWAINLSLFQPRQRSFYLTNMAVHPDFQRQGWGREMITEARRIALAEGGDAIRLDAYDVPAGAGPFYAKCGFAEVGRAVYRAAGLIYYELTL
jgi:ribosomal protein S18 acetylase RimI-like enzyme